jgi:hypothetical protein
MFAQKIIDSDAFLDMPLSSQALYFHLSMRADDDGFVSKPKSIQRLVKAADDDMRILISKRYILAFDTGIIVIKHWKIHNYIRADRKTDTIYEEEKSMLSEKKNGSYTEADGNRMVPICTGKDDMSTICQPYDNQLSTNCQHRLGKDSIGKDSIGKDSIGKDSIGKDIGDGIPSPARTKFQKPSIDDVKEYCTERNNSVDPERFVNYYESNGWKVGKNPMKDWRAAVRTWEKGSRPQKSTQLDEWADA